MWIYEIRDGKDGQLFHDDQLVGTGYSGAGLDYKDGRNNPNLIKVLKHGPIPPGEYIIGPPHDHPKLGPVTMNLTPYPLNEMFDRDAFRIHGNNARNDASEGCIILARWIREMVASSCDTHLLVRFAL